MKDKCKYILFLNNRYDKKDNSFYLKSLRGKYAVAVDGGIRFFLKNKIYPDILIGDFDSTPPLSEKYLMNFDVIRYPSKKDKTDSQLALELALARGATDIEICGALGNREVDHVMGNILLLDLVNKFNKKRNAKISARIIAPRETIYLANNSTLDLTGKAGDYISIIPLSDGVMLDFDGLVYPSPRRPLEFGDSLTLRNELKGRKCRIRMKGKAAVAIISK